MFHFLADKPKFAEIAREFVEYVSGAELIIHNAAFDVEFLDLELDRAGLGKLRDHAAAVVDTLAMARERHPGKRNSLDALCERYAVANAHRTMHGALLDARLLADVYLALTRGQGRLEMDADAPGEVGVAAVRIDAGKHTVLRATEAELKAHEQNLNAIDEAAKGKGGNLWRRLASVNPDQFLGSNA